MDYRFRTSLLSGSRCTKHSPECYHRRGCKVLSPSNGQDCSEDCLRMYLGPWNFLEDVSGDVNQVVEAKYPQNLGKTRIRSNSSRMPPGVEQLYQLACY